MHNLNKPIGTIYKLLFALILALALVSVSSCDGLLDLAGGSQGGGQGPEQPGGGGVQPTEPTDPTGPTNPTTYHDFPNFNPADYVIINETGKSDSEIAWVKDAIWLMYAENEYAGDWTANYIKTNKIKTILFNRTAIRPDQLDRLYINESYWEYYNEFDDDFRTILRENTYRNFMHETMHLAQYSSGAFDLMKGMRPDICAAADMLVEFLAWFYTDYFSDAYVSADMPNAVEIQSKYMVLSTDPDGYAEARAKDPSLPTLIHTNPWFNNDLSTYAQHAFGSGLVRGNAMTAPLIQASREDVLRLARALLACRDPKTAGVTDDALYTVFDTLRRAAVGDNKYLKFSDDYNYYRVNRESFNRFQTLIAEWDAAFEAQ